MANLAAWMRKWKQSKCRHDWRPARTSKGPAKYCDDCELVIELSDEEFYALFGRTATYV